MALDVTGDSEVIGAVTAYLARRQIIAAELRVEQSSLDDAFIALTSHPGDAAHAAHAAPVGHAAPAAHVTEESR